jgi:uncharacterized peroxidase-related enzyme
MIAKTNSARIPLLERDEVPPEMAELYEAVSRVRGVVPNMVKTLAHTPSLAVGVVNFLKPLLSDGALKGWYKELLAVRLSALQGSYYAVSAHSLSARQKGASLAQVAAVKDDFETGPFTEAERLGFRCADRLHHSPFDINDDFFAKLKNVYNDPQIIELMATAAAFELFPRFVEALRIPATPVPKKLALQFEGVGEKH